ncbi:MAG: PD-(D/E)XK nuclease family protein [Chloroflexi bacterium]|nr:PD-(D/E)XK nuclease family protein [Chloroflexota bacterium]
MRTYQGCPLQYRYAYVDRLPRAPRKNLQLARRIHVALRTYFLYAEYGPPEFQRIAEAYSETWDARRQPEVINDPVYQDGLRVLRGYFEAQRNTIQRPVMVEQRFKLHLGAHEVVGKLDRVDLADDGQLEIIDYKLDREIPDREALERDTQLGIYLLAVEELQGRAAGAASRYYLRHNVKVSVCKTSDEREQVAAAVAGLGDRIERDDTFIPTPGKICSSCSYRKQCPAVSRPSSSASRAVSEESSWVQGQPSLASAGTSYVTPELPGL